MSLKSIRRKKGDRCGHRRPWHEKTGEPQPLGACTVTKSTKLSRGETQHHNTSARNGVRSSSPSLVPFCSGDHRWTEQAAMMRYVNYSSSSRGPQCFVNSCSFCLVHIHSCFQSFPDHGRRLMKGICEEAHVHPNSKSTVRRLETHEAFVSLESRIESMFVKLCKFCDE